MGFFIINASIMNLPIRILLLEDVLMKFKLSPMELIICLMVVATLSAIFIPIFYLVWLFN
jgi:hypothetical protein